MSSINDWASEVYEVAGKSGWHGEGLEKTFPECIALIHSELSEALETWRKDEPAYYIDENGKPEGHAVELCDAIIRTLDCLKQFGIHDIEEIMKAKNEYNKTRGYRHGNKRV